MNSGIMLASRKQIWELSCKSLDKVKILANFNNKAS